MQSELTISKRELKSNLGEVVFKINQLPCDKVLVKVVKIGGVERRIFTKSKLVKYVQQLSQLNLNIVKSLELTCVKSCEDREK